MSPLFGWCSKFYYRKIRVLHQANLVYHHPSNGLHGTHLKVRQKWVSPPSSIHSSDKILKGALPTRKITPRWASFFLAEGEGFEPSKRLLLYTLSRRASSTTPAPFRTIFYSTQFVLICSRRASIASLLRLLKKKIPSVLSFQRCAPPTTPAPFRTIFYSTQFVLICSRRASIVVLRQPVLHPSVHLLLQQN